MPTFLEPSRLRERFRFPAYDPFGRHLRMPNTQRCEHIGRCLEDSHHSMCKRTIASFDAVNLHLELPIFISNLP